MADGAADIWREVPMTHLDALQLHLSHERIRLANARTEGERACRAVWVSQIEKEIAAEMVFLAKNDFDGQTMTDDELLAELSF
jgi:hypothetical protein